MPETYVLNANSYELALLDERPTEFIVGREPSWLVRSGISLISIVFVLLLLLAGFIRFPDVIRSQISITTSEPPSIIVSQSSGRILELYINNNENIQYGQNLLLIDSSVNYKQLQTLESALLELNNSLKSKNIFQFDEALLNFDDLGELQPVLDQLVSDLNELFIINSSKQLIMKILNADLSRKKYRLLQQQLGKKKLALKAKLMLGEQIIKKNRLLLEKGVITASDILAEENNYIDKQLALADANMQLSLYEVELEEIAQNLSQHKIDKLEKLQHLKNNIFNKFSALTTAISHWKQRYLIRAPVDGLVSFSKFWSVNQHVIKGDNLLAIANNSKEIVGKIYVSLQNAGKVKLGQKVDIELIGYPAVEFGKLVGKVKSISLVPDERGYLVDIAVPQEMISTYGKKIPFSSTLMGNAKVIADDKSLLERFLEKILYVFS